MEFVVWLTAFYSLLGGEVGGGDCDLLKGEDLEALCEGDEAF